MEEVIAKIRSRLAANSYPNEASISHSCVMPILRALGWDDSDPQQVMPEYASGKGRVDFALFTNSSRPSVFVEVKGVGRSLEGDRQLLEYAFHEGVPLCLLTDGREWSFYLPSGQGSYEDRRVYRLQLDDRTPKECADMLRRYLQYDRVKSGAAQEDARKDYQDVTKKREASRSLPRAWTELLEEPEELLVEIVAERAEKICGFRPSETEVLSFLRSLGQGISATTFPRPVTPERPPSPVIRTSTSTMGLGAVGQSISVGRQVSYSIFGIKKVAPDAATALVAILREFAQRNPNKIVQLAEAVRGISRNHIAQTVEEIYPRRPDLARASEFHDGWLVGLNIANREKMRIIRTACDVFGISLGHDLQISLPNADA